VNKSGYFFLDAEDPERLNPLATVAVKELFEAGQIRKHTILVNEHTGESRRLDEWFAGKNFEVQGSDDASVKQSSDGNLQALIGAIGLTCVANAAIMVYFADMPIEDAIFGRPELAGGLPDVIVAVLLLFSGGNPRGWMARSIYARLCWGIFGGIILAVFATNSLQMMSAASTGVYCGGMFILVSSSRAEADRANLGKNLAMIALILSVVVTGYCGYSNIELWPTEDILQRGAELLGLGNN
jgi:hypothetical protein